MKITESKFSEVRTDYEDEEMGRIAIDVWTTADEDEEGRTLGWYSHTDDDVLWENSTTNEGKNDIRVVEAIARLREDKGKEGELVLYP